eukprot:TRINITY_DN9540_c0_g1_i2.p1 TRINITY_DN9540_c0_g1~~TRINITY_DN9540_c0_g1_i2.p1  ORF type:complete len:517 (+),score=151.30 TRINITY_DN9540_c0_g1_i2:1335-2885(+)
MVYNDHDFANYQSGFYLGGLDVQAKKATVHSIQALHSMCRDETRCRRRAILRFFEQEPAWEGGCGSCDVCLATVQHADDLTREFSQECSIVLAAANKSAGKGKTKLTEQIRELAKPTKLTAKFLLELVSPLVEAGYLKQSTESFMIGKYSKTFLTTSLTPKGHTALDSQCRGLSLPVPASLRRQEAAARHQTEQLHAQLREAGMDLTSIPQDQLDSCSGPIFSTQRDWCSRVRYYEQSGQPHKAQQLQGLKHKLFEWREAVAIMLGMAPGAVMPDHIAMKVAYTVPSTKGDLESLGLRITGVEELLEMLQHWKKQHRPQEVSLEDATGAQGQPHKWISAGEMVLPVVPWAAEREFQHRKPIVIRKSGPPAWLKSYERFEQGETISAIAMNQESGKMLQEATIAGHVLTALLHCKPLSLSRYFEQMTSHQLDRVQWDQIEEAAALGGVDVTLVASPPQKEILRSLVSWDVHTQYTCQTESQKAEAARWYTKIRTWIVMKQAGFVPTWDSRGSREGSA